MDSKNIKLSYFDSDPTKKLTSYRTYLYYFKN